MMPAKFKDLCLDAADDRALAQWWCTAMGYTLRFDQIDEGVPEWSGPLIWINLVPEANTVKNRMHLDVTGVTSELVAAGATLVRRRDAEIRWDILADPEGNEFCVFAPGQ
jgi:hypothetical protein